MIHMPALSLPIALTYIAGRLNLDTAALIDFAYSDPHGGYHSNHEDGFPTGSLWRVEGQSLYALIRALKPQDVLELGTWHGASATHILQALHDNQWGSLYCVDNRAYGDITIGDMIPGNLEYRMTPYAKSLEEFIEIVTNDNRRYDFIFEDAMHDAPQVEFVWRHADKLLNPGGVIVSHDAMHAIAGVAVREGIAKAGYADKALSILIDPSDCGLAMWRKESAWRS